MNTDELISTLPHHHERIVLLQEKFGKNYPTIAIKRDNYEYLYKDINDLPIKINNKNNLNY